jgi:ATP-dependent Clp protease ATP-binding subunit ClpB
MAIRWDKLTVKAQEAVQRANDIASEHGNPELQPVHILAALLEDHEGIVAPLLERVGLQVPMVQAEAIAQIDRLPNVRTHPARHDQAQARSGAGDPEQGGRDL